MAQDLVWLEPATQDLALICSYLEDYSPDAAERLIQQLLAAAESLPALPHRGRLVRELPGYRELLVAQYRLVYRLSGDTVYIARVIHGRRDFPGAWKEQPKP